MYKTYYIPNVCNNWFKIDHVALTKYLAVQFVLAPLSQRYASRLDKIFKELAVVP